MKIAAAYIRVSTDDQIEFSPDSQLERIKDYAEKNGFLLPKEFIFLDEGISGRNTTKRPAFNTMIGLAKRKPKPFDIILVWKFSRFARNRQDSVVYKSMLRKELNIDVISISEDVGDEKMSILIEALIEAMDEYYSINLAEEVKRGMTEKAKRGGVLSIAAFGYKIENGEFVVVPEEAEVVKKVFSDYLDGKGFLNIAKTLNALGIKTHRGNPIENRTIEYWLNNPVYIGKIRWNPDGHLSRNYTATTAIISQGTHVPIIDIETWDKVQEKMKAQKAKFRKYYNPDRKDLSHWLIGIARCGKCGAVLCNQAGFLCCSKKGKGLCEGVGYIRLEKLEQIALNALSEITPADVSFAFAEPEAPENKNIDNEQKIVQTQIQRLKIRLERIKVAYEEGIDTIEEYRENKKGILSEIEHLERVAEENQMTEDLKPLMDKKKIRRLQKILEDANISNTEKNKVARTVFKEITKGGTDNNAIKVVFWK